jgi:hypothetical protein
MQHCPDTERRRRLIHALSNLSLVRSLPELVDALRASARKVAGSDGITIIRREGERVAYIAEDAQTPLWTGHDFPIDACISGLAMLENRPILIPDIYADARVPHAAYAPTFVKSMAMFPIGSGEPQMAMGAYWGSAGPIDPEAVSLLSSLARTASEAFARVERHEARAAAAAFAGTTTSHSAGLL